VIKNQKKAYAFALISILFWSTSASVFKISLKYTDEVILLLISSFISSLCFLIILIFKNKLNEIKAITKKNLFKSICLGFFNPFFYYIILFKAYSLLPAQQAQPINMTWGIIIAILSIPFLKQKLSIWDVVALFTSFFGVVVIATKGNLSNFAISNISGVVLAVISSFIWAVYWLLNTKDKLGPVLRLFYNFTFGFIFTLVYYLVCYKVTMPHVYGVLGGVYIGLFEMGITFYFWILAMKYTNATVKISILVYIAPFISLIFIYFFVGEKILFSSVFGLIFIVSGILIQLYKKKAQRM